MKKGEIIRESYYTSEPLPEDLMVDKKTFPQVAVKRAEGYIVKSKRLNSKQKNGCYLSEIHFIKMF
jgi:hypothetical protein